MTPRDDDLEHPRLGALYRAASREEPPEHVDEAIRASARRHRPRRYPGWVPALATAAVLVLAVTTVLRISTQTMEADSPLLPPPAADEAAAEAPTARSRANKVMEPEMQDMVPQAEPHAGGYSAARRSAGPMPAPVPGVQPGARQEFGAARPASSAGDAMAPVDSEDVAEDVAVSGDAVPCEPPEPALLRDPAALKRHIDMLESEGRDREAACLRRWLPTPGGP